MTIFLHHYPPSLFSEKVRLLLGYHRQTWSSVIISSIMPRPLLMPLTGGYRKTPVLQIDANVYCDSKIIARGLARHCGDDSLYRHGFVAHRVADWADTQLFQVTVALNFSPEAIAGMMGSLPPGEAEAFRKDRAELSKGASITSFTPEAAGAYLSHYLDEFEASVAEGFLFGDTCSIADFSVYHCLWFVANNAVNARRLEAYPNVAGWMGRMAAFGHGDVQESNGEAALASARAAEPTVPNLGDAGSGDFAPGQEVDVTPVDYGRIPVRGRLVARSSQEIVVERESPETGSVMVHFPSAGFEMTRT
jgi:glutathione S-transferase